MISKETLVSKLNDIGKSSIDMLVSRYSANDFESEESEQSLYIFRINKPFSADRETFIIQALIHSGINPEYIDRAFFETFHFQEADPVIAKEIIEEVTSDLTKLKETDLSENVSECTVLVNEWNYICLYLEKPDEALVIIWETSA